MTTTVENSLSGPSGSVPSASSLARTARAGTVGLVAPERAVYSATQTLHALTTTEVSTHYQRTGTLQLGAALPPTGPWYARWYVWMPGMQAAGRGINEVRWHAGFPDAGLGYVIHETAAGNIGSRLQSEDLDAAAIGWDVETGTATAIAQWWRVELEYDGTDFTSRVFPGHATTGERIHIWYGRDVGRTIRLSGYRYQRGFYLPYGNTSFDQVVANRQQWLMDLGYPAPQFGADGYYGSEMANQWDGFAPDVGMGHLVGTFGAGSGAGAEVLAALELAHTEWEGAATPPPLYLSNLAVSDTAALGPAALPGGDAVAALAALADPSTGTKGGVGQAVASLGALAGEDGGRGGNAFATLGTAGVVDGAKHVGGDASALLGTVTEADGTKHAFGQAVASLGVVATVDGTKHTSGSAVADLALSTLATQLIEPVPPVQAVARIVNQPEGTARASGRPAGTAHPIGRIDGSATRR